VETPAVTIPFPRAPCRTRPGSRRKWRGSAAARARDDAYSAPPRARGG
jgi:hypothetical protein